MKIAVVGSGISGLAAAWLLRDAHEVHLFERADRLGGHTHTVVHERGGAQVALDTGFLVFNERTYPLLVRFFELLGVASQASDMSFSISCKRPDFEYGTVGFGGLLAQPANLFKPSFYSFLYDVLRFGRVGRKTLATSPDPDATVADFFRQARFGQKFSRYYLTPMVAAIWSSGRQTVGEFPRDTLLRFFDNHGLLDISGHPQWRTVSGGSHRYVQAIGRDLGDGVHAGLGVDRIRRDDEGVTLELTNRSSARFDHVVVATHADQALAMLAEPTAEEERLLGAWDYSVNDTWLHTDSALMPRRRRAWASWNYLIENGTASEPRVSMTYHLNRLQGISGPTQYFVSLNPPQPPAADRVLRRMTYQHPVYTRASVASQERLLAGNGSHRTHYCGAYLRNGFHEDGLWSAVQVAADLGVQFP